MLPELRSAVFTAYNIARPYARNGYIDGKRLNAALGIALNRDDERCVTTLEACSCPDYQNRKRACKHMLAKMLRELATQLRAA